MSTTKVIVDFLLTSLVGGLLGAVAMQLVMRLIARADWAKYNMIVAVGSLLTRSREHAWRTGVIIHAISAVGFAMLYTLAMMNLGLAVFPRAFFAGIGFGTLHGLFVSLALVWVVSERHPLEEFQRASFAVGVTHFAGHIAYGAIVGLVIGLFSP